MDGPPDWIAKFTPYVAERLAGEGVTGGRELNINAHGAEGYIGTRDQWLVIIKLEGDHLVIQTPAPEGGPWQSHVVRTLADLDTCFPEIARSTAAWIDRLTVHRLEKGRRYRIVRDFADFYGNEFTKGTELTFDELHFLPHDDGYTLRFVERGMWLKGGSVAYAQFGLNVEPAD